MIEISRIHGNPNFMRQTEVLSAAMLLTEKEKSDVIVELLDEELHSVANDREVMMDSDSENEISHEGLLANFEHIDSRCASEEQSPVGHN